MPRPGYDDVVLVTGFPAFQARKLAEHLLDAEPRTLVYAVVHEKLARQAEAARGALPGPARERLVLLQGDAAAMDLGLSGSEFRAVSREVDRIHHVAHVSYLGVDRATAEPLHVRGAVEVLELAGAAPSLRCLVHHSTAAVSGDRRGRVHEHELDEGQGFPTIVEETRAAAERVMRRAMPRLPVAVVRPTTIVGDSGTGEIDRLDGPYLLVLLILASPADVALPLPARGDRPLHVVPVDFVVRAARALGLDPRAPGGTFHLADPYPLSARRVFELVARAGGRRTPRGFIPANVTRALLRAPGLDRLARSPRAFVTQLASDVAYDTRQADRLLSGTGITCPPFEAYVEQLVSVVKGRLRARRAPREEIAEVDERAVG